MNSVFVKFAENITLFSFSAQQQINLQVGYETLIKTHFKYSLPTPYETELAIITIENAIENIHDKWQNVNKIITDNEQVHIIANYFNTEKQLNAEQVEQLFNRMADVISGSPIRELTFFTSVNFMATLLILREVLHHLNIRFIEIV